MPDDPSQQQETDPNQPEGGEQDLDSLPSWARDALSKANREAANYRSKLRETEPLARKAKELEDASKSESQKLSEERDGQKSRADKAEVSLLRMEVALDKAPDGMSLAQVRKLAKRLSGSTQEELEADADELFSDFVPGKQQSRRPKERLRSGVTDDDSPTTDMNSFLAEAIRAKRQ